MSDSEPEIEPVDEIVKDEWFPLYSMATTFVIGYIYGSFFGVWVCPK